MVLLINWFFIANASESRWGIPSILRGSNNQGATKENILNKPFSEDVEDTSQNNSSMIYLKEVCLLCCHRFNHTHYPHTCFTYSTHAVSFACLKPPAVLRPSETHTEQEDIEIQITKLLLKSYYDIVRKNIEDLVPKAIMHFLVRTSYLPKVSCSNSSYIWKAFLLSWK